MRAISQEDKASALSLEERLRSLLQNVLGLQPGVAASFAADTPLFGALPELDSMAVATLLTEIEDNFHIIIDDDDVDGDTFETFGSLAAFVEGKVAANPQ